MTEPIKNMLVGFVILASIIICVLTILFLKPTVGDGKQTLYVRFSNIRNVDPGTRVLFGGKPIGEVVAIEDIPDAREQPTDELGRVYFYQLTLHIDSHVKVYNTDEISVQSTGLMGEKSITITPKAAPPGITPKLIGAQPIYADSVDMFQNAMADFSELAAVTEDTLAAIGNWVKEHGSEVADTVKAATATLTKCETAITEMEDHQMFENLADIVHYLKTSSKEICDKKGTLGKLIGGNDLYLQMNAVMTKANNLMNDFNQYGVLFHLNKQWQRAHLRRLNQLDALDTPQGFSNYFQTEVDEINSSMMRLSMLMDKAGTPQERRALTENTQFKADFAKMLKKSQELSDNLRLFNEQLSENTGS